jgi:putative chitinase
MLTLELFAQIMPLAKKRWDSWLAPLNAAMEEFDVDTPLRQAMFLAQLAHESGELRYQEELATGAAYDTGKLAARLGNTPEADGDGQRFKGHGPIQITGHENHRRCSLALFHDLRLLDTPRVLTTDVISGARSAAWFWQDKGLNAFADRKDILGATKKINGGTNGLPERERYYARALRAYGV